MSRSCSSSIPFEPPQSIDKMRRRCGSSWALRSLRSWALDMRKVQDEVQRSASSLREMLSIPFRGTPQLADESLSHLEIISLLVPRISEDRISDIAGCVMKRWLTDF